MTPAFNIGDKVAYNGSIWTVHSIMGGDMESGKDFLIPKYILERTLGPEELNLGYEFKFHKLEECYRREYKAIPVNSLDLMKAESYREEARMRGFREHYFEWLEKEEVLPKRMIQLLKASVYGKEDPKIFNIDEFIRQSPFLDLGMGGFTNPPKFRHYNELTKEEKEKYIRDLRIGELYPSSMTMDAKRKLNAIYGYHSFESHILKALREDIEMDIKAVKEAWKEMAKEAKKKEMSITVNEEERVVTVVFEDGSVRMSRCSKDDHFDPVIGVAMCIAARKLGSRTKLKKYVENNARFVKPKKKKVDKKDENSGK